MVVESINVMTQPQRTIPSIRKALPQVLATGVKNVLLLGFGMTLGFPTILIPSLSGNDPEERISLGEEALSWIGSLNLICVPVGCLLTGAITQPLGRRRAMQLVNIPFVTSWLIYYFSNNVWQVFLALCISGMTGGLLEAPTLTYVAEITTPNLRGILASTSTVAVIVGILVEFLLGTFLKWRTVALLSSIMPVIAFLLLFLVPESPHWLVSKKRFDEAHSSIAWLRGWVTLEEVDDEFKQLCKQFEQNENEQNGKKRSFMEKVSLFADKSFLWPFGIVSLMFFLGHFSGLTTLQTYAVKIFATLHAPIDKYYATIFLGVAEVLGCIISACLVHYVGKRKMNFLSLGGCGVCFFIVATYANIIDVNYFDTVKLVNATNSSNSTEVNETAVMLHSWLPSTFLILAAFFSHTGIRLLPWMLVGEVYSNDTRASASGFSGGVSYVFGFISNKIFFSTVSLLTLPGTFWMYSCTCFVGLVLIYFLLPETEGKTLYDITEHFAGRGNLGNKLKRKSKSKKQGVMNSAFSDENANSNLESRL